MEHCFAKNSCHQTPFAECQLNKKAPFKPFSDSKGDVKQVFSYSCKLIARMITIFAACFYTYILLT